MDEEGRKLHGRISPRPQLVYMGVDVQTRPRTNTRINDKQTEKPSSTINVRRGVLSESRTNVVPTLQSLANRVKRPRLPSTTVGDLVCKSPSGYSVWVGLPIKRE